MKSSVKRTIVDKPMRRWCCTAFLIVCTVCDLVQCVQLLPHHRLFSTRQARSLRQQRENAALSEDTYVKLVNPYVGTEGEGHVWVGAAVPHGMLKVGLDSRFKEAGYSRTDPVTGMSFTHVSGTGGGDSYSVPSAHPLRCSTDELRARYHRTPSLSDQSSFALWSARRDEVASPGYFGVTLNDIDMRVELTATARACIQRYTVPALSLIHI